MRFPTMWYVRPVKAQITCQNTTLSNSRATALFSPQSLRVCIIYVISVMFMLCLRAHLFIGALWSSAGKGLTSWLSFVMPNCEVVTFPIGIPGQVRCLIVSIPDLCSIFLLS